MNFLYTTSNNWVIFKSMLGFLNKISDSDVMNEQRLREKAKSFVLKASEKADFEKYGETSEGSPFYSMYKQVIKMAEFAAFTDLQHGKSDEEAIESALTVIKRSLK